MHYNDREKASYALKSSIGVVIFSTLLFVISCLYMAVKPPFAFWWILLIIVILQVIVSSLYCWFAIIKIDVYDNSFPETALRKFLILIILELLLLNIFAFVYGLYTYKKVFYYPKAIL